MFARARDCGGGVGHVARDQGALGTADAQAAGDGTGVDTRDTRHPMLGHEITQALLSAPVRYARGQIADHEAGAKRVHRLIVFEVDTDVADLGCGHHHDLAAVGRIGEDFLIPRDGGVEHQLARLIGCRAESGPAIDAAVLQGQKGGRGRILFCVVSQ